MTEQLLVIVTAPSNSNSSRGLRQAPAQNLQHPAKFGSIPLQEGAERRGAEAAWGEAALEGTETETGTQGGGSGAGTQEVRSGGGWRQVEVDIYTEIRSLPPSIIPTLPEAPAGSCRPRPSRKPSG